eukprot:2082692-Rhodomonas_salina.2
MSSICWIQAETRRPTGLSRVISYFSPESFPMLKCAAAPNMMAIVRQDVAEMTIKQNLCRARSSILAATSPVTVTF